MSEPRIKLEDIFTFDLDNLTKEERDLLLLDSEIFEEEVRRRNHNYYMKNQEYYKIKRKEFYDKNPEKIKQYNRDYMKSRPDFYKEHIPCKVCDGFYVRCRLRQHLATKKHIEGLKKIKVKEDAKFIE